MNHSVTEVSLVGGIKCYIEYLKAQVKRAREEDGKVYAMWYGLWIVVIGIAVLPVAIVMRVVQSIFSLHKYI